MTELELQIQAKLTQSLSPTHLEVTNDSHKHARPGPDTHYQLVIVAAQFAGQSKIQRHRDIYKLLAAEMQQGIHALSLHLFTPEEWQQRQRAVEESPNCLGGGVEEDHVK